jgi:hypothetical protein
MLPMITKFLFLYAIALVNLAMGFTLAVYARRKKWGLGGKSSPR